MVRGPKTISRHPIDFTVTITSMKKMKTLIQCNPSPTKGLDSIPPPPLLEPIIRRGLLNYIIHRLFTTEWPLCFFIPLFSLSFKIIV